MLVKIANEDRIFQNEDIVFASDLLIFLKWFQPKKLYQTAIRVPFIDRFIAISRPLRGKVLSECVAACTILAENEHPTDIFGKLPIKRSSLSMLPKKPKQNSPFKVAFHCVSSQI